MPDFRVNPQIPNAKRQRSATTQERRYSQGMSVQQAEQWKWTEQQVRDSNYYQGYQAPPAHLGYYSPASGWPSMTSGYDYQQQPTVASNTQYSNGYSDPAWGRPSMIGNYNHQPQFLHAGYGTAMDRTDSSTSMMTNGSSQPMYSPQTPIGIGETPMHAAYLQPGQSMSSGPYGGGSHMPTVPEVPADQSASSFTIPLRPTMAQHRPSVNLIKIEGEVYKGHVGSVGVINDEGKVDIRHVGSYTGMGGSIGSVPGL
jgi:hypothetical protein